MNIRRGTTRDTETIKALWAYCFERPGDPFFEWYFSKACRMEDVLLGIESGQVACDLHLRPYTLSLRGKRLDADYIVGVATHPAARGRGLARQLLAGAFRASRKAGKPVDILMPSDGSFYQPEGFSFYCHQWERKASPLRLSALGKKPVSAGTLTDGSRWQELARIYAAYTAGRNGYTLRDAASWAWHIESQLKEGYIAVVYDEEGPAGYLFYAIDDRQLTVSEMAFARESGRKGLYAYMAGHLGSVDTCVWYEPSDDRSHLFWQDGAEHTYIQNRTFPYMMARLTDPAAAFSGVTVPESLSGGAAVAVTDPVLAENSGVYMLTAGKGKLTMEKGGTCPAVTLTAGGAAQLLFGVLSLEELIRYGEAVWTGEENREETAHFLTAAFPPARCWVNEWY